MILRVLRARVVDGASDRLAEIVRDEAVAHALVIPGLLSFQPAVRETGSGMELVIVSTWSGFDAITAVDPNVHAPLAIPGAADMLENAHAEHYELVLGEARAMPLRRAKLRLTRIPIKPNVESAYYAAVRAWAEQLLDNAGLVAFTLGRRVIGRQDDIIAVQIWQDEAALREMAGSDVERPMGDRELSSFWAARPVIEHFDALTAVEPRPDAPALLVADDRRRYVHATPAASRLSGRPLARLLTMSVDDVTRASERGQVPDAWDRFLANGSAEGPYLLARPDGSEVRIRYAAKANAPWPGSHTSLLVPVAGDEGGEAGGADRGSESAGAEARGADPVAAALDVDRALVEAGFVARYTG